MSKLVLEALAEAKMASGHLCLNLSARISWDEFPDFAEQVIEKISGQVERKYDAVDMRIWCVKVRGAPLRFVFDDYPPMVSLEASDAEGDLVLKEIYHLLYDL